MPLHTLDIFGNLVSLRIRDEAGTPLDLPGLDARSSARKDSPLGYKESGLVPKYTISVVVVNRETCCDLEGSIVAVPEGRELAVIKESCVSKDDLTGRAFDLAGKLVKAASEDARIPTR
jgi:hypothetical protein